VACWSTKAAIGLSLKRVKIEEKLHEPIGTHQRFFERYHPGPPTASCSEEETVKVGFPKTGVSQPHPKLQSLTGTGK